MTSETTRVSVERREPKAAAVIHTRVDVAGIPTRLAECFPELMASLARRAIPVAGVPFVRYLTAPPGEMEIEVGVPVPDRVEPDGRVEPGELPGGLVAVATHHGAYDRIAETYGAMMRWIGEHDRRPVGPMWECYRTDPQQEPDPSRWETEIVQPIA
jgi:effector-binding domain-containing protein